MISPEVGCQVTLASDLPLAEGEAHVTSPRGLLEPLTFSRRGHQRVTPQLLGFGQLSCLGDLSVPQHRRSEGAVSRG